MRWMRDGSNVETTAPVAGLPVGAHGEVVEEVEPGAFRVFFWDLDDTVIVDERDIQVR